MNSILLNNKHRDNLDEVEAWLRQNVGRGTRRYRVNTWMGVDDWLYYEDIPPLSEDGEALDQDEIWDDEVVHNLVFVFRREEDSTMFAIKWA